MSYQISDFLAAHALVGRVARGDMEGYTTHFLASVEALEGCITALSDLELMEEEEEASLTEEEHTRMISLIQGRRAQVDCILEQSRGIQAAGSTARTYLQTQHIFRQMHLISQPPGEVPLSEARTESGPNAFWRLPHVTCMSDLSDPRELRRKTTPKLYENLTSCITARMQFLKDPQTIYKDWLAFVHLPESVFITSLLQEESLDTPETLAETLHDLGADPRISQMADLYAEIYFKQQAISAGLELLRSELHHGANPESKEMFMKEIDRMTDFHYIMRNTAEIMPNKVRSEWLSPEGKSQLLKGAHGEITSEAITTYADEGDWVLPDRREEIEHAARFVGKVMSETRARLGRSANDKVSLREMIETVIME